MAQPDDYSRLSGQILISLILLAGIAKCWSISRRPTTNAKCVWGLMLVLAGWICIGFAGNVGRNSLSAVAMIFRVLAGGVGMLSFVAASVFLVLGVVELKQHKDRYTQGKSQAIWAFILLGCFALIAGFGFYRGLSHAVKRNAQVAQPPGGKMQFEELNFQFQIPDKSWVQVDKEKLNPIATFVLRHAGPQATFVVIAEKLGVELDFDTATLVENMKANIRSVAPSARFSGEKFIKQNGLAGTELLVDWEMAQTRIFSIQSAFYHNGHSYQLILNGEQKDREFLLMEARKLRSNFNLIEPERVAHAEGMRAEDHQSRFGYNVELKDLGWRKWTQLSRDLPDAEFGVLYKTTGAFAVIPISLFGQDHTWEAVAEAALGRMEFQSTDDNLRLLNKSGESPTTLAVYSAQRESENSHYDYRIAVVHLHHFAFVAVAWHERGSDMPEKFLDQAVAQLKFRPKEKFMAPSPDTFSPLERQRHGLFFNDLGLFYYKEHDYEKALKCFETAVQLGTQNVVFFNNLVDACIQTKQYSKALEHLSKADPKTCTDKQRAMQAFCLSQTGQEQEAIKVFASLFAGNYRNDNYFTEYLSLLVNQGEKDVALTAIDKYLKGKDTVAIRLWQASLYREKKEFTKAIELLQTQQKKFPSNTEIATGLWQSYHAAGRDADALALCEQLLAKGHDSAKIYELRGRTEFALKHYREAKSSFETSLKKQPANNEVKEFLDHVSGILGEGDNSGIKTVIAAVPFPEALLKKIPPLPGSVTSESGAHYEYAIEAIFFEKDEELKSTQAARVRVNDASAVSYFSALQLTFDPLSEEIFVNQLAVRNELGHVVATGNVADYYVLDAGGQMATQSKVLHIPIAGLQPGYTLEWAYTRRDLRKPNACRFQTKILSKYYPVARSMVYLCGDIASVKHVASANLSARQLESGLLWQIDQPMVFKVEPSQQNAEIYLPVVRFGDPTNNWNNVAGSYLDLIKEPLALQPDIRAIAQKCISGATNEAEKIIRLAHFVQSNLTYKAIEFGRRAYIPNAGKKTMQNRYGDCKDHTLLLHQLMQSVSIPSHLALVHAYAPIEKALPSLDQFNHMILYAPSLGAGTFLDCTAKDIHAAEAAAGLMSGLEAFVLDPVNPRFVTISGYPTNKISVLLQRELRIEDTDALIEETVALHGLDAVYHRALFKAVKPAQWKSVVQNQIGFTRPLIQLEELHVANVDDLQSPLTLRMTSRIKNCFQKVGNTLLGTPPFPCDLIGLNAIPVEQRQSPFHFAVPRSMKMTTTLSLPKGYKLSAPDSLDQSAQSRFVNCKSSKEKGTAEIKWTYDFHLKSGRYPAGDYDAYVGAINNAIQMLQPHLRFEDTEN